MTHHTSDHRNTHMMCRYVASICLVLFMSLLTPSSASTTPVEAKATSSCGFAGMDFTPLTFVTFGYNMTDPVYEDTEFFLQVCNSLTADGPFGPIPNNCVSSDVPKNTSSCWYNPASNQAVSAAQWPLSATDVQWAWIDPKHQGLGVSYMLTSWETCANSGNTSAPMRNYINYINFICDPTVQNPSQSMLTVLFDEFDPCLISYNITTNLSCSNSSSSSVSVSESPSASAALPSVAELVDTEVQVQEEEGNESEVEVQVESQVTRPPTSSGSFPSTSNYAPVTSCQFSINDTNYDMSPISSRYFTYYNGATGGHYSMQICRGLIWDPPQPQDQEKVCVFLTSFASLCFVDATNSPFGAGTWSTASWGLIDPSNQNLGVALNLIGDISCIGPGGHTVRWQSKIKFNCAAQESGLVVQETIDNPCLLNWKISTPLACPPGHVFDEKESKPVAPSSGETIALE